MNAVELLAPAGSYEAAKAAVNAGADAVYMGGPLFSARAYAESSKEDMLLQTIRYCHLRGVKVYMTLNTLMKEREFAGLYEYLLPYVRAGLDAVIVQDLGVLSFVRERFPALSVHASTQMTVTGRYAAKLLKKLGVSRIVAARELSLSELREIHQQADIEIEAFVHGALCYCYSGQCLMSSFLGGRSGNRGRCAGPCRLPYEVYDETGRRVNREDARYVLSLKDFNTLSDLRALTDAGVMSLKIEGRMKSPLYVAAVVSLYRKYLDNGMPERTGASDERLLREVFDRGGSTDGYLRKQNGRDMVALSEKEAFRVPDEGLLARIREQYVEKDLRVPVKLSAEFSVGEPASLTLSCRYREIAETVTVRSAYEDRTVLVQAAEKKPVEAARIRESLGKFGNTDFMPVDTEIRTDGEIFFPVRELNELRRKAADELTKRILARFSGNERTVCGTA